MKKDDFDDLSFLVTPTPPTTVGDPLAFMTKPSQEDHLQDQELPQLDELGQRQKEEDEVDLCEFVNLTDVTAASAALEPIINKDDPPQNLEDWRAMEEHLLACVASWEEQHSKAKANWSEFSLFLDACERVKSARSDEVKKAKIASKLLAELEGTPIIFWWKRGRLEAAHFTAETAESDSHKKWYFELNRAKKMALKMTKIVQETDDLAYLPKFLGESFKVSYLLDIPTLEIVDEVRHRLSFTSCFLEYAHADLRNFHKQYDHLIQKGGAFADEIAAEMLLKR